MSERALATAQKQSAVPATPAGGRILQRKCACGNHTMAGGECAECSKVSSGLQRKLTIGASNDPLEQEADRAAEAVASGRFVAARPSNSLPAVQRQEAPEKPREQPTQFPVQEAPKQGQARDDDVIEKLKKGGQKVAGELAKILWDQFSNSQIGKHVLAANERDLKPAADFFKDFVDALYGKIALGALGGGAAVGGFAAARSARDAVSGPAISPSTGGPVPQAPKDEKFLGLELKWDFVTPPTGVTLKTPWIDSPNIPLGPQPPTRTPALPGSPVQFKMAEKIPRICTPADPQGDQGKADARSAFIFWWLQQSRYSVERRMQEMLDKPQLHAPPKLAPSAVKPLFKREPGPEAIPDPQIIEAGLRSPGQPLDPATRTFMEPRFGYDFSQVRIHTDARAAESARAVNAMAYTFGQDVVFGPGRYSPETSSGAKLLAHELTHTIQQAGEKRGRAGLQRKLAVGASNDPQEQEADRVAKRVMAGSVHALAGRASERIQRDAGSVARNTGVAPPSVEHALASTGDSLPADLRADMEQRFGYDFSRVRVHTDSVAGRSARDVNANAYTVGCDIVFGARRYQPTQSDGRELLAHELTHVVQQSKGCNGRPDAEKSTSSRATVSSSDVVLARQQAYTKDLSKLDADALEKESSSISAWFDGHIVGDPDYALKLQLAADLFAEISSRRGAPATAADIAALKERLVARSPRTTFELRLRRGEFPAYKPIYDKGVVVGYSRSSSGYTEAVDLDGKIVWSSEIPLETPLLDPIDLIPFELLGSLAAKAATIGLRAVVKAGVRVLAKDVGKVVVEEGVKLGTKEAVTEAGKVGVKEAVTEAGKLGAQKVPGAAAKEAAGSTAKAAAGDVAKAAAGDVSKSSVDALVQVFRKGEKLKSFGAVSLKRLRNVLGRAGVSPSRYKLVKVPKAVAEAMEKEVGEPIWGFVNQTGAGVARDLRGRPIINFTPRALASLEEAVKTFGHEAKHLKDFAAGLTTSSEALAEKEGEKLWLVVLESLGEK